MHELEAHQVARELGRHPVGVARLYEQDPPQLATAGAHRAITDISRQWLALQQLPTT
jgi:hypothetical protein